MEGNRTIRPISEPHQPPICFDEGSPPPFSQEYVTITKQEHIDLTGRANYWEAQHARVKSQVEALRQEIILKDAKIKDLRNRLFGKKSEKNSPLKSEKGDGAPKSGRNRGQQPGTWPHPSTRPAGRRR